jgi:hypothetical protein
MSRFLSDGVLPSTRRRKADDGGAHPGTKSAGGAGNSLTGVGRADNDGSTLRRFHILRRVSGENYGHGCNAKVCELIGMFKRVRAEIDPETVLIGLLDGLPVRKIREDIVVREGEAAPALVCRCNRSQCGAIYRRLIVARKIARNVVPPERCRRERPDLKK